MAAEALEQSVLESKDKDQLLAIAKALGLKASSRTKKAEIIDSILEMTGSSAPVAGGDATATRRPAADEQSRPDGLNGSAVSNGDGASAPVQVLEPRRHGRRRSTGDARRRRPAAAACSAPTASRSPSGSSPCARPDDAVEAAAAPVDRGRPRPPSAPTADRLPAADAPGGRRPAADHGARRTASRATAGGAAAARATAGPTAAGRRRRARRGRPRVAARLRPANEPVEVSGYLDMRDEGYGFLRVKGYLPSREDSYIPVKLARQYGLRKGDHVTGTSRPAGRNEKNPALLDVLTVNGADPEQARRRPRFEDLTALFPDENLQLEDPADPTQHDGADHRPRVADRQGPAGHHRVAAEGRQDDDHEDDRQVDRAEQPRGQADRPAHRRAARRGHRHAPPRPAGEVIASTFDRPSDEHTHVAELAIEKAKRLVEQGEDVVVILDGITRLSRAYNLAAPASGRILSGGIDAGALYPPKKFFGAARNVEEGGSLTILATALVETNSRMDEAIFEEFKGTGNMELRLDRRLAERRIYPAIDVDASSTRHEELLFDRKQLQMVWKLRRVLSGLAADGNAAPGLELLIDRLKTFRTNAEFLNEIAKQPSVCSFERRPSVVARARSTVRRAAKPARRTGRSISTVTVGSGGRG